MNNEPELFVVYSLEGERMLMTKEQKGEYQKQLAEAFDFIRPVITNTIGTVIITGTKGELDNDISAFFYKPKNYSIVDQPIKQCIYFESQIPKKLKD